MRPFRGVWIPAEVWLCDKLSWEDKIILTDIESYGECPYETIVIAERLGLSDAAVKRSIKKLKKLNWLQADGKTIKPSTKVRYIQIEEEEKPSDPIPYPAIVEHYHTCCPTLQRVLTGSNGSPKSEATKRSIKARCEEFSVADVMRVIEKAGESTFLTKEWGKANLLWLMKPEKFIKTLQGDYDDRRPKAHSEEIVQGF